MPRQNSAQQRGYDPVRLFVLDQSKHSSAASTKQPLLGNSKLLTQPYLVRELVVSWPLGSPDCKAGNDFRADGGIP